MSDIIVKKNKYYDKAKPLVSICTPVYNRINTIQRTFDSIINQDYKSFEYIIVDDGSTDGVEKIINKFMNYVDFPCIYIHKDNGGVHTARNLAVKFARGKYFTNIDSDDEFLPNAISTFVKAWDSIPKDKIGEYREIVALCVDDNNNILGNKFPDNINQLDMKKAQKLCDATGGEHISMDLTKIRKENLFPEPKGVKMVMENILWRKLYVKYRSYYINEPLRIYHRYGDDHLSNIKKKNIQTIVNILYNAQEYLNNDKIYIYSFKERIMTITRYLISRNIVKKSNTKVYFDYSIKNKKNQFLIILLYVPCLFGTYLYKKKKM